MSDREIRIPLGHIDMRGARLTNPADSAAGRFARESAVTLVRFGVDVVDAMRGALVAVLDQTGQEPSHFVVGWMTLLEIGVLAMATMPGAAFKGSSYLEPDGSRTLLFLGVPVYADSSREHVIVAVPRDSTWCAAKGAPPGSIVLPEKGT